MVNFAANPTATGDGSGDGGGSGSGDGGDLSVTFVDTPGQDIFFRMRNYGAEVADFAILMVSAEDGVCTYVCMYVCMYVFIIVENYIRKRISTPLES